MIQRSSLIRMVEWTRQIVGEVLEPGDLAVDLTAGTGRDTLYLYQCVGGRGRVLAFDIQETALRQSAARLAAAGAAVDFWSAPHQTGAIPNGVHLIHDSHARLKDYLCDVPRAVVANLGYLPGGDSAVVTTADSTLPALRQALARLAPAGRLVVTAYVGHAGGRAEATQVDELFRELPAESWNVLRLEVANRSAAPFLLAAEKHATAVSPDSFSVVSSRP